MFVCLFICLSFVADALSLNIPTDQPLQFGMDAVTYSNIDSNNKLVSVWMIYKLILSQKGLHCQGVLSLIMFEDIGD